MEKISITNLIEFRRRSEKRKKSFLNSIQKEKKIKIEEDEEDSSGGNYWVSCLSAISNVFSTDDKNLLGEKVNLLRNKIISTTHEGTQKRWQKNIDILYNFEDYDFNTLRPMTEIKFHKKPSRKLILKVNDIPIESKPHHIFSYSNKGSDEIGAIWFVAKKDGYKKNELGIFCDVMHRHITLNYSDKYKINPEFCIVVDIFNGTDINYSQLLNGDIVYSLEETINEVKRVLSS